MSTSIEITVGGKIYTGWQRASCTRSMLDVCHSFSFESPDGKMAEGDDPQIKPGTACAISVGGELISTGYVDSVELGYDADGRYFRVSGRSKTCDIVDCSAIWPGGRFVKQTIGAIARALCLRVGIDVVVTNDSPVISSFSLIQGESIFECITRYSRLFGLLCWTNAKGNLVIERSGHYSTQAVALSIEAGRDQIFQGSRTIDFSQRFKNYIGKAQSSYDETGYTTSAQTAKATVADTAITRARDLIIVSEEQATTAEITKRIRYERNVRRGQSDALSYVFKTLKTPNGKAFSPGTSIRVQDAFMRIDGSYLCSEVALESDFENGDTASISLVGFGAFDVEPVSIASQLRRQKTGHNVEDPLFRNYLNGGKND